MKRIMNNRILLCAALMATAVMTVACNDWTADESLNIEVTTIDEKNAELYQQYLANLRSYKNSDHRIMMGWFDNSNKQPWSKGSHLDAVPDSVDFVTLMYPDNLADWEVSEMASIRKDKGTRVLCPIDCDAITQAYKDMVVQNDINGLPTEISLYDYLSQGIDPLLPLMDKYGYHGVAVTYTGTSSDFLSPAEKNELAAMQSMIFGKVNTLISGRTDKLFVFEGMPMNVIDKSYLEPFRYIILNTSTCTGVLRVELAMTDMLVGVVPTDRIIVTAMSTSSDPNFIKNGKYFTEEHSTPEDALIAMVELAKWVVEPHSYGKSGLGIYRINDSYYNTVLDYRYVRQAIGIMNPSPNN